MGKLIITKNYGVIPNHLLNNPNLSFRAKGLFAFLQSKPNGWQFSAERIASQTKEGITAVKNALKELEKTKFLIRKPTKDNNGKWAGYDYFLTENPSAENPLTENPLTENLSTLSNKDNSKKDIVKKNKILEAGASEPNYHKEIIEIFDIFKKINPTINYGHKTNRKAIIDLIKMFGFEQTKATVNYAISIQGKKFAPVITTPYQLKEKIAQLKIYYETQEKPNKIPEI